MTLAGLTPREEIAMGMLVGKTLPGWQCNAVAAGRNAPLPPSDLYVVDLAGSGWARWTQAAQSELLKALGGVPAVLVVPAFDQSWLAFDERQADKQPLVFLHKPYGTEEMQAALQGAAQAQARRAASVTVPVPVPVPVPVKLPLKPPASAQESGPVEQAAYVLSALPVVTSPSIPEPAAALEAGGTMTTEQFQAWLDALPPTESPLFLRKLGTMLALHQAFEVRLSVVNRLICDPADQWAASNAPASTLVRLSHSDALAVAIEMDVIDGDALRRAQRLDLSSEPLGPFLWRLVQSQPGK